MHAPARLLSALSLFVVAAGALPAISSAQEVARSGNSLIVRNAAGMSLRITPYGEFSLRVQALRAGEQAFPDSRYAMVDARPQGQFYGLRDEVGKLSFMLGKAHPMRVEVDKSSLALSYFDGKSAQPLLAEQGGVQWQGQNIVRAFVPDTREHFTALGHGYFGRAQSIDLRGQTIERNYGRAQIEQSPLIVPFYISSKGYGVFLNSGLKNVFRFDADGRYEFGLDTLGAEGRMDYFFIAGGAPRAVLTHYLALTGKPRLPPKAVFGLALSDKSHDHDTPTPSDEAWWKQKITDHRAAGYPLDHVVNDNRWRAGGGKRCESYLDWDRGRFPDPAEYARWLKQNGLITTIDVNRCIVQFSEGWQAAFNVPEMQGIDFVHSAPDLTSAPFRKWFWDVLYKKSLSPKLGFPGDALWIDEFDEMGAAPASMPLANGLTFGEMRNSWFMLIAQALVEQGWDKSDIAKRPYVWVRGMTAGAQRYASLWSGDIKPNFDEMKLQIRGMQLAGLSGFPFWGHDAGGFYDWEAKLGPDADVYMQWAMGWGSFAPIWKPHGMGTSRWPLDRSAPEQAAATQFTHARYELMPYIYNAAHEAAGGGLPMARAMLLAYPQDERAWRYDLQYMWGPDLLVAPRTSKDDKQALWLPPGIWYDYWNPRRTLPGDSELEIGQEFGLLPVFVKAGAIVPRYGFALSTAFQDKSVLSLDVYRGADGKLDLVEDDDVTEQYRRQGKLMSTSVRYDDGKQELRIAGARGSYAGAPQKRSYQITLHGASVAGCFTANGKPAKAAHDADAQLTTLNLGPVSVRESIAIHPCAAGG